VPKKEHLHVVVVFGRRKSVLLALAMDPHGMSHALM